MLVPPDHQIEKIRNHGRLDTVFVRDSHSYTLESILMDNQNVHIVGAWGLYELHLPLFEQIVQSSVLHVPDPIQRYL